MKLQEKVEHWLDIAEYDLETAAAMQNSQRYLYTVFMCQQAVEKLLKALYLQQKGEEAPRTHNLAYLFNALNLPDAPEYFDVLGDLNTYYIEGRYPSYKQKLSKLLDKSTSRKFLVKTQKVFKWLKSQLILNKP